jgi:serine 3-dehydrogenase
MAKTILITGATAGFGAAMVERFAADGWQVIATGRRADRLQKLADKYGANHVHTACFDIRDTAAMEKALADLPDSFRKVDALVNNAGLALGTEPAQNASLEKWMTMIETNITGLVTLTHKLLPMLIQQKGIIINISSVAASYPYPGGNVYGATKAFVSQFSLGLRSDLHGTGVRVTSIEPGLSQTEFTLVRTGGNQAASDALYKGADPITGEDIANTVYWVATQPAHINFNKIEIMATNQSWPGFQIYRNLQNS